MKTYMGIQPFTNIFILGEPRQGRIELDISEEDLNRYQVSLLEYEKIYQELYNLYRAAISNQGTTTKDQKV